MTGSLEDRLREWIVGRGYSVETYAAVTLSGAGFFSSRGNLYIDPKTQQAREIDVVASRFAWADRVGAARELSIQFTLIVECKYAPGIGWVVFEQPVVDSLRNPLVGFLCSRLGFAFLDELGRFGRPPALGLGPGAGLVGYDLRAGPNPKDDADQAHSAYAQVLSAARARASYIDDAGLSLRHADIVVPLLVIDGPLYSCAPGSAGEPLLARTERAMVLAESWDARSLAVAVHVVTRKGLVDFVKVAYADAKLLLSKQADLSKARRRLAGD